MVKTLKEMGIQLGERNAEKKCLEDLKANEIEIEKLKNDVQNLKDLKSDVNKLKELESDFKILQVYMYIIQTYCHPIRAYPR